MVNIVDIRDIPGVVVLCPAEVAEVDGEAGDGDHGGADSHQQDGDVGRRVRSEALLGSIPCMSLIYCELVLADSARSGHQYCTNFKLRI